MPFPPSPYGGAGGGLLAPQGGGFGGFSPLTQFGLGLLAQSGPSLTPQSPWAAIGKAGAYASEAQQQALQNELIRAKLGESQREAQAQQRMSQYFSDHPELTADNPVLGALLQYGGPEAVRGVTAALADPTLGARREAAAADLENTNLQIGLNRAKLGAEVTDNQLVYVNARAAEDAVDFLANKPGGSALLASDDVAGYVRAGTSLANVFGVDPGSVLKLFPGLSKADPKDIPAMLTAAETAVKARQSLASLVESGSTNAGVLGLQTFLTGQAAGAGLDVQHEKFKQARMKAEGIAKIGGADWSLPEPETYLWRGGKSIVQAPAAPVTAGGSFPGVQNGQMLPPSAPPVTTDLPPPPPGGGLIPPAAAAPAPAPTPKPVKTQSLMTQHVPELGTTISAQVFPREADGRRAVQKGEYYWVRLPDGKFELWRK